MDLRDVLLKDEEGKTPPVDSSAMMYVEDAWPSPVQTPLAENPTRPADKEEGEEQVYPVGSESTLHRRQLAWEVCPVNVGPLFLEAHHSQLPGTRKIKVLTPWMPQGPARPHIPVGAESKDGDFDLSGEVSQYGHHLYVNIDHLDGSHELGGPLRGRGPSRGQGKRASRRRSGGGHP